MSNLANFPLHRPLSPGTILPMARTPRPEGWQGGSEDFTFTRTLEGHRAVNVNTDPDLAADVDFRRNSRTTEDVWLGGEGA